MLKQPKREPLVILATHVRFHKDGFVESSAHQVRDFLCGKGFSVLEINYSLKGSYQSEVSIYLLGRKPKYLQAPISGRRFAISFFPFRCLLELLNTLIFVFRNRDRRIVFVGVDPLNALAGCLAKSLRLVGMVTTYTADYAHRRFENRFFNSCYHLVDRLTIAQADEVWGVSSRIVGLRSIQRVPSHKNFRVPNSPLSKNMVRLAFEEVEPHTLAIVSKISKATDFVVVIDALSILREKVSDIKLNFIGSGGSKDFLVRYAHDHGLQKSINFLGFLSHADVYKVLSRSAVGIAPYTNKAPWVHYCDPMKIHDYLACGLPVVTTDVPALAHEVVSSGAGEFFDLASADDLAAKIFKIISDPNTYKRYRAHAIKVAGNYSKDEILNAWLRRIDEFLNS